MNIQMPLSSQVAGWLVTAGTFCSLLGAYILGTDKFPFGVNAQDYGLTLVVLSNIANFAVVALRRNAVPLITSGVGTE